LTAPASAPSPPDRPLQRYAGEMRAELATLRRGPRKALLAALVRILETLLALIVKFEAGELAAAVHGAAGARGGEGRCATEAERAGLGREADQRVSCAVGAAGARTGGFYWGVERAPSAENRAAFSRPADPAPGSASAGECVAGDDGSRERTDGLCAPPRPLRSGLATAENAEKRGGARLARGVLPGGFPPPAHRIAAACMLRCRFEKSDLGPTGYV
jgi:hypothetical protein